jgi:uncharacterized protein (DUF736 family)
VARRKPKYSQRSAGLKAGWRSGLEEVIADQLKTLRVEFDYEKLTIRYTPPVKERRYTPDFRLLRNGIIVEAKGRFVTADRQKHLAVKAEHPDLDIRFVFSNSRSRISKQSTTTYALWCQSKGFQYADKEVPLSWLKEPPNERSLAAIRRIMEGK